VPCLNADILYLFFDSANMHRWNDHLRPVDLTEIDKQAHKAMIAWVLASYEEAAGNAIDWPVLIEHGMFSFIQRAVLTDLKPQVFHRIVAERRGQVADYVISEFDRLVPDADPALRSRFREYLYDEPRTKEDAVLRAAHYLATRWEFNLIYDSNRSIYGIDRTREEIDEQINQHQDLVGMRDAMSPGSGTFSLIDLFGQLRFQQRWARTPRIPKTSVLGHSLMVANMMYLHDCDVAADDRSIYNDYYTGLFHDLPEVLTKDVITPIKVNVDGLAALLEDFEHDLIESTIMPLIDDAWKDRFRFLVYDPFSDEDHPEYGVRRGSDVKACDLFAAYMEAYISVKYGVSSSALREGCQGIRDKLVEKGKGIDAMALVDRLDKMRIRIFLE